MHRFGRSANKWKDRWAGNFLLIAVLVIVGSYFIGNLVNKSDSDLTQVLDSHDPPAAENGSWNRETVSSPRPLTTLYMVQVGSFGKYENADRMAVQLDLLGFPSWVSAGPPFKVMAGAYTSRGTAHSVGEELQGMGIGEYYAAPLELLAAPAMAATTGTFGVDQQLNEGFGALESYVHEAAAWFDEYQAGGYPPVDGLSMSSQVLEQLASGMASHGGDPVIGRFLDLAHLAAANARQVMGVASTGSPDDYRAAMTDYMDLLGQYRQWTEGH